MRYLSGIERMMKQDIYRSNNYEAHRTAHNRCLNNKFYSVLNRYNNLNDLLINDYTNECIKNYQNLFNTLDKDNGYYAIVESLFKKMQNQKLNIDTMLHIIINSIDPKFEIIDILNKSGNKSDIKNKFKFYDESFIIFECKYLKNYFNYLLNSKFSSNNVDILNNINKINSITKKSNKNIKYYFVLKTLIKELENNEINKNDAINILVNTIDPELKVMNIIKNKNKNEIKKMIINEIGIYNIDFIRYELSYIKNSKQEEKKYINKI